MKRIVVCGSNSIVLAGLVAILDRQPDLQVVGSFPNEVSPILLNDCRADLLLLEQTPDVDWCWLEGWMSTKDSPITGILLTDSLTAGEIEEYLDLGFKGFLPRPITLEEITAAIAALLVGLIVIHPDLASFNETDPAITPLPELEIPLTPREAEVLRLLGDGLDNKAIASRLQISKHTVKFHISSIFSKLDVSSRTEAVTWGLRRGLIRL